MFTVRVSRAATKAVAKNTPTPFFFKPTTFTPITTSKTTPRLTMTTTTRRFLTTATFTPIRAQRTITKTLSPLFPQPNMTPTPVMTQRRNMSIGSYVSEKIEGKKMEMQQHKERESFRHLRDYLISTPKFRFKEQLAYYEAMQAKIGKTDRLVGGQDVRTQEEMMKKKIEVFKAMTPLEQLYESPAALNMMAKSRISVATGFDRKTIDGDLKHFDEMKTIHTWIHRRLKNGKSLPEDSVEMQKLMNEDPPPPSYQQIKAIQKAKQASRSGSGGPR